MRRRFLVLRAFSLALRVIGWLFVIAGLAAFIGGVVLLARAAQGIPADQDLIAGGFAAVITGLVFVLYGEVIEVFFDIEANTRRAAELIERIAAAGPPPAVR